MACRGEETIARLVAGDLSASAIRRVDDHLAECSECRGVVADVAHSARADDTQLLETTEPGAEAWGDAKDDRAIETLPRGEWIGRYVVREPIAAGGMGVVYLARDSSLNRNVTLKLLRSDRSEEKGAQASLFREAQTMAQLSHPNVVAVYDVGTFRSQVFVAMEFVEGENLRDWMQRQDRSWSEVLERFLAAGRGLAAAHEVGIVHRDFKPSNVLVGKDGRVRVTDFGIARAIDARRAPHDGIGDVAIGAVAEEALTATVTEEGVLKGTPAYMAPEQFAGGKVDGRTDMFSFCVALYEGLYGHRPFASHNLKLLAREVLAGNVRPPPESSKVPPGVRAILLRGLAVDPAARFASMSDLLRALEGEEGLRPIVAVSKRGAFGRSRRTLVLCATIAAVAFGGWIALRALVHRAPPPPEGPVALESHTPASPRAREPDIATAPAEPPAAPPTASVLGSATNPPKTATAPQPPPRAPSTRKAAPPKVAGSHGARARPKDRAYDDAPMEPSFARSPN